MEILSSPSLNSVQNFIYYLKIITKLKKVPIQCHLKLEENVKVKPDLRTEKGKNTVCYDALCCCCSGPLARAGIYAVQGSLTHYITVFRH